MQSANAYKLKIGEKRFSAVIYRSPSISIDDDSHNASAEENPLIRKSPLNETSPVMGRHPVGVKGRNLTCFARNFSFIFVLPELLPIPGSLCRQLL